jgi:hypothetical protein
MMQGEALLSGMLNAIPPVWGMLLSAFGWLEEPVGRLKSSPPLLNMESCIVLVFILVFD